MCVCVCTCARCKLIGVGMGLALILQHNRPMKQNRKLSNWQLPDLWPCPAIGWIRYFYTHFKNEGTREDQDIRRLVMEEWNLNSTQQDPKFFLLKKPSLLESKNPVFQFSLYSLRQHIQRVFNKPYINSRRRRIYGKPSSLACQGTPFPNQTRAHSNLRPQHQRWGQSLKHPSIPKWMYPSVRLSLT